LKDKQGKQRQLYIDASLDNSGWSPAALERLLELHLHLPVEPASHLARTFGLMISGSELERVSKPYLATCQGLLQTTLSQAVTASTSQGEVTEVKQPPPARSGRMMVLQTDGVFVLKRPENGYCEGMEIKTAVLYPQNAPQDRVMLADGCSASEFLPMLSGLVNRFCTKHDFIVGIGDGAAWVEEALDTLADVRITDVYHSAQYLDVIMQALAWDEHKRTQHRKAWCKGEISAQHWLSLHLPPPEQRQNWSQEATTALNYLIARLEHMNYPAFKTKGYPIGSGQVEAMNKNVIGNRLKRSGMHWSTHGAAGMAATRALSLSKFKLFSFNQLRFLAYPSASSP
jgi:hypothetical protein